MTFGFKAKGANNSSIISSEARCLVYVGKATPVGTYGSTGSLYARATAELGLSTPICREYKFEFTAPSNEQITPAIYCPNYGAISYCTRIGANRWSISCFAESQPEIFIFVPIYGGSSGWGMSVWDAQGRLTFCSNYLHMYPRALATVATSGSSISTYNWNGGSFYVVAPRQDVYTASIPSLTKPLLVFSSGENAANGRYANYYTCYFSRGARVRSNQLQIRWMCSWQTYWQDFSHGGPSETFNVLVLDGADYE